MSPSMLAARMRDVDTLDLVECLDCGRPVLRSSFDAHRLICQALPASALQNPGDADEYLGTETGNGKAGRPNIGLENGQNGTRGVATKGKVSHRGKRKKAGSGANGKAGLGIDAEGRVAPVRHAGLGKMASRLGRPGRPAHPIDAAGPPIGRQGQALAPVDVDALRAQLAKEEAPVITSKWESLMRLVQVDTLPRPMVDREELRARLRRQVVLVPPPGDSAMDCVLATENPP